jgi:hypothetical protein
MGFDGPAQTLGMATIAFMLALKLVVETLPPVRFLDQCDPTDPVRERLQLSKAIKNAQGGQTDLMVTDLGILVLIILIVLIVRAAIIRRRTGWNRVNSEIRANALRAREAQDRPYCRAARRHRSFPAQRQSGDCRLFPDGPHVRDPRL